MKKNISMMLALLLSANIASMSPTGVNAENTKEKNVYGDGHFETPVSGDINFDGVLNAEDVVIFQKWFIGLSKSDLSGGSKADINSDGKVNIADFCLLKSKLLGESDIVSPSPVTPLTQPLNVKDMDELISLLKNYDIDDYETAYHESLSDMFERLNQYGYVYHYSQYENSEDRIELSDADSPVCLIPYSKYEDAGIYYNVTFKGKRYQIRYYMTDSDFAELDMEQYIEKRLGGEHEGVKYNHYVFSKFKSGNEYNPVAYCMLGADHYCEVRSYDTEEDLLNILKVLKPEKKLIYAPVIEIDEGPGEADGYKWHLITEDGSCYSADYAMFKPGTTEEDVIEYIISAGEKEKLIQDEESAKCFAEISENAAEYIKSDWTSLKYTGTMYSDYNFSLFGNDENGMLKKMFFCSINENSVSWRDNETLQNFVKLMISRGYIKADEFWNCTYEEKPVVLTDIKDLSVKNESAPPCMDCFYEDDEYIYYFDEYKSESVICSFSDGTKTNIAFAFFEKKVVLSDLDKFGIKYFKAEK